LTNFCQIIHLTGKDKNLESRIKNQESRRYHSFEFLTSEMANAYAAADLVVSRAGLNSLIELAALKKPVILIPLPASTRRRRGESDSPQEANAQYFAKSQAAIILEQEDLTPASLCQKIKELILNQAILDKLSHQIGQLAQAEAEKKIVDQIFEICYNKLR